MRRISLGLRANAAYHTPLQALAAMAAMTTPSHTAVSAARHCTPGTTNNSLSDQMKANGFVNPTPNFSGDLFGSSSPSGATAAMGENLFGSEAEFPTDLVTVNAENVDVVRDLYGPWLVMTNDLQGELFVDRDQFVFYRPANGLGYGVGRLEVIGAKKSGTAFTMKLATYTYQQTTTFAPHHGVTLEVTGMVKKVSAAATQYETFSLIGIFRKDDPNSPLDNPDKVSDNTKDGAGDLVTGQFNAAKLSPWKPTDKDAPWAPKEELQQVFHEVFPTKLTLDSHLKRRAAAEREAATNPDGGVAAKPTQPFHIDLEKYRVGPIPSVYYIPDYINEEEEAQMVSLVKGTPAELKSKAQKRTVQEWGCTMCDECNKSFVSDANMPPWVQQCADMLTYDGIFAPTTFLNSVRIHEYEVGEGIGPHCDGPIYVPCVTVLSLASTSVMNFYPRQEPYFDKPMEHYNDTFKFSEGTIGSQTPLQSVVMEPRSLLIFADLAYYHYPHGVSDKAVDNLSPEFAGEVVNRQFLRDKDIAEVQRQYRVSITTRNLLTRCNHQPARAEYNMKRTWYLYNQQPVPSPLFLPFTSEKATAMATAATPTSGSSSSSSSSLLSSAAAAGGPHSTLTSAELAVWEAKMDRLFAEREDFKKSIAEVKELLMASVSAEDQFRRDTSTILNNLTTTILDVDAKMEDLRDDFEEQFKKKEK